MTTTELSDPLTDLDNKMTIAAVAARAGVNPSTAWRWVLRGVGGVRLSTFVLGGKRYTTPQRLARFLRERTAVAAGELIGEPSPAAEARRRTREIAAADAELAQEGL